MKCQIARADNEPSISAAHQNQHQPNNKGRKGGGRPGMSCLVLYELVHNKEAQGGGGSKAERLRSAAPQAIGDGRKEAMRCTATGQTRTRCPQARTN